MTETKKKTSVKTTVNTAAGKKQTKLSAVGKKQTRASAAGKKRTGASAAGKKQTRKKAASTVPRKRKRQENPGIPMSNEIMLIASFGVLLIMMFSNFGYCGTVGECLANFCFGIFGCVQYVMPVVFFLGMTILIANDYSTLAMKKCGAAFVILTSISAFAQLLYEGSDVTIHDLFSLAIKNHATGGIIGGGFGLFLRDGFGTIGAIVILCCVVLLSLVLLTQRSFVAFFKTIISHIRKNYHSWRESAVKRREERAEAKKEERSIRVEEEEDRGKKKAASFLKMKSGRQHSADKLRAKQCEEKVKELESRKEKARQVSGKTGTEADSQIIENTEVDAAQKKNPEAKKVDGTEDIRIHVPLFTSSDEVKRKDSVRELHPQIYPFTEEDGKTEPFRGELDFSAFTFQKDVEGVEGSGEFSLQEEEQFVPPHKGKGGFASSLPEEIRLESVSPEEMPGTGEEDGKLAEIAGEFVNSAENNKAEILLSGEIVTELGMDERDVQVVFPETPVEAETRGTLGEPEMPGMSVKPELPAEAKMLEAPGEPEMPAGAEMLETPRESETPTEPETLEMPGKPEISSEAAAVKSAAETEFPAETSVQKASASPKREAVSERRKAAKAEYIFPPLSLLTKENQKLSPDYDKHLRETARKLQQTLESFGVRVTITDISCGPTVTRYEMFPEQGTKVSKIVSLTDDIKLNLAASDIRIEAPIPGKAAIGIEVPNKHNMTVHFRELAESRVFRKFKSKLAFAVGKDIGGKTVVADLAKMPHLLIAGATGSGKSVCINTLIMSLLYKATPEEVKLIMIDPKMVELSIYNGIPHLLIPVVTDPKKASGALNWAVAEMTQRYKKFTETGVRNIEGYNKKVKELIDAGEVSGDDLKKLPQIVIIVDELADLMMVAPGEVEDAIVRLSQLARAAGLHLVIATQRPSVNVITGLIKANVPSRIAFSVSSGVDSRTIIDMNGAEKLLGKGDMLFYPSGYQKPVRVQGAFVSDQEISRVVEFLKENEDIAVYDAKATKDIETKLKNNAVSQERDEYFEAAARFIMEKDKATIGMLQRMFKIGFNRAARIIDQLADAGIVGPEEGTKPRKILMSPEQLETFLEESV